MKSRLVILLIIVALAGCHKSTIEPEDLATVVGADVTMCAVCGGWFIRVDSTQYRADLPRFYAKQGQQILIRYTLKAGMAGEVGRWIDILSIQ